MARRDPSDGMEQLTNGRIAARWFGVLGPLLAMLVQQELAYASVLGACHDHQWLLVQWPTLLALIVVGLAFLASRREYARSSDDESKDGADSGSRFFGITGLLMSGLGAALILAQWLPTVFIGACHR